MICFMLIGLGGALGAMGRFGLNNWAVHRWPGSFPAGTFFVNLIGSMLLGLLVGYGAAGGYLTQKIMLFLGAGFMGSFTTFSTFSVEVVTLVREKGLLKALYYPVITLLFGTAGAALGLFVGTNWPG